MDGNFTARGPRLRHDKPPFATSKDEPGPHDRLPEDLVAEGFAEVNQVPRQVADAALERADGGSGEVGAVST